jgi:hypothetical protein
LSSSNSRVPRIASTFLPSDITARVAVEQASTLG